MNGTHLASTLASRDRAIHEATPWMAKHTPITARIAAIRTLPALLAALERVEWVSETDGEEPSPHNLYCPWCGNYQWSGHDTDCDRAAALRAARGEA